MAFQINGTETARISSTPDNIVFGTGSAATTRATLTSTGLGIGVTPSYKLDVKGGAGIGVPAQRWEVDGGSGIYVELERDSGGGGTATFGTQTNHNLHFKVNDTVRMLLPSAGDMLQFTSAFHVSSATATGTTPAIQSGTYTPTLANVTNVSATGEAFGRWLRVGNVVTVSGAVQITPTGTGSTVFGISLPIDSDLTADGSSGNGKLNGTIFRSDGTLEGGGISGDVTNNRAQAAIAVTGTSARYFSYHFTYEVLA